jgi:EpsI family protein
VAALPQQLGEWRAVQEHKLDSRTSDVLGADEFVSRTYRNPAGEEVAVQLAIWSDHSGGPTGLHYPEVCYRNAGWQILQTVEGEARTAKDSAQPLRLMGMEKSGATIVTAHWFQMGDATFFSTNEARAIHRRHWGERYWPCEVKVLLQTSAPDIKTARPKLEDIGAAISAWTRDLY